MMATLLLQPPTVTPETLLAGSPLPELRRLFADATETTVTLSGRVSTYHLKQLAQEAVRPALHGRKLLNQVQVAS